MGDLSTAVQTLLGDLQAYVQTSNGEPEYTYCLICHYTDGDHRADQDASWLGPCPVTQVERILEASGAVAHAQ